MFASFQVDNSGDMISSNTEIFGNGLLIISILKSQTNLYDLDSSQPGPIMFFTLTLCAVPLFISMIISRGIPSQIFKSIIGGISIIMTGFHSFWTFTYERSKN